MKDDPRAKSHVLTALESAPRFRAAQRLLLQIVRNQPADAQEAVLLRGAEVDTSNEKNANHRGTEAQRKKDKRN